MEVPKFFQSTTISTKKKLMYYLGAVNFMFVYTILAYSISVFLIERDPSNPNAIFFVGLILGLSNFFALFVDSIWAYAQKIVHPRKLLLGAIIGLFITVGIFLGSHIKFTSPLTWPIFTVIAAFSYGWSFNLYDITMTNIILNTAKKTQLAQELSQKKVAESLGMFSGMIIGGLLLYFGSEVAQIFLMAFLTAIFIFFKLHFEKEEDEVALTFSEKSGVEWKKIFQSLSNPHEVEEKLNQKATEEKPEQQEQELEEKKNISEQLKKKVLHLSQAVSHELSHIPESLQSTSRKAKKVLEEARLILLDMLAKENEVVRKKVPKRNFHIRDVLREIGKSFQLFLEIFHSSSRFALWWVAIVVMFFSFWDTMAITFQPLFLGRFQEDLGIFTALILPLFVLPIFFLQMPLAKMSDKYGAHIMVSIGVFLSAASLLAMGMLDIAFGGSVAVLIIAGMGNAIGYTAAFSPAQAKLISEMRFHLIEKGVIPQNEEVSSVLRLTLNVGNILGQILGGFLFAFIGFLDAFLLFGSILFLLSVLALIFFKKLSLHTEESKTTETQDTEEAAEK
jgi:MFS family permease